jgi:hypothetical protein
MDAKERMLRIAAELAKAGSRELKGEFGEQRAMKWFERHGYDYYRFPQTVKTMPKSLARRGGKRPDFAVDFGGDMVYFDAKFHLLPDATEFALEEVKLQKFLAFREWVRDEMATKDSETSFSSSTPRSSMGGGSS